MFQISEFQFDFFTVQPQMQEEFDKKFDKVRECFHYGLQRDKIQTKHLIFHSGICT